MVNFYRSLSGHDWCGGDDVPEFFTIALGRQKCLEDHVRVGVSKNDVAIFDLFDRMRDDFIIREVDTLVDPRIDLLQQSLLRFVFIGRATTHLGDLGLQPAHSVTH